MTQFNDSSEAEVNQDLVLLVLEIWLSNFSISFIMFLAC